MHFRIPIFALGHFLHRPNNEGIARICADPNPVSPHPPRRSVRLLKDVASERAPATARNHKVV